MKQNKNFFGDLDGRWGEVLADTYKEASEPILSFDLVDKYKFLWKPVINKEEKKINFVLPRTRPHYTLDEAKLFHYTTISLLNKDYKIELYKIKNKGELINSFTIYTCLADVIVSSSEYDTHRLYTDIIKEYLGEDNIEFLNTCGGFEVTYDNFNISNPVIFISLDDFFNSEEWLEIYLDKNDKLKNMLFHYMGDYENNFLTNPKESSNYVIKELFNKSITK